MQAGLQATHPLPSLTRPAQDGFGLLSAFNGIFKGIERSLVYYRPAWQPLTKAALPGAVEGEVETSDGERLLTWGVPPAPGRPVVLYFHGNCQTVYSRPGRFRAIAKAGFGVIGLSYRGYASSSGSPSEEGLLRDAEALYRDVRRRYPGSPVILWGYSLGTGVAIGLAADHAVGKVVLEAPFTSIADVGSCWFPFLPMKLLMSEQFRSDKRIGRVTAPLLVMHGEFDTVVPSTHGRAIFAMANHPKRLVLFKLGDHMDLDRHGATRTALDFIDAA